MFRRLENESTAITLPKEWTDNFKQVLLNLYGDKCISENKSFEVYAYSYPEEVLLIASYVGLDKNESPVTLFLSANLNSNLKADKLLNTLFDSVGVFFDHYFGSIQSEEIFDEYVYDWQEEEFNNLPLFYKITRENVALTIEANKLLAEI